MSTVATGLPPLTAPPLPPVREAQALEPQAPVAAEAWPDDVLWEEVNGQRVEKQVSCRAVEIATLLAVRVMMHALPRQLGRAVTECVFLLNAASRLKRRPDVAFISKERWALDRPAPVGDPWPVVPDWVIEIVSPSNLAEELLEKILEYFQAGVRLVWVVYPKQRMVFVWESPTQVRGHTESDELNGGSVLPELRLTRSFFLA